MKDPAYTLGMLAGLVTHGDLSAMAKLLNDGGATPRLDELEPDPVAEVSKEVVISLLSQQRVKSLSASWEEAGLLLNCGLASALDLVDAEAEPAPAPESGNAPSGALGLGYVRMELSKDAARLACRSCGQSCGVVAWAEVVSNGTGGAYLRAPICGQCRARGRSE